MHRKSGSHANRPGRSPAARFLLELETAARLKEQELSEALLRVEAVEALHERMLAKVIRDGLSPDDEARSVAQLLDQQRRMIAETSLPALFAEVDAAYARYQKALDCCRIANDTAEPAAVARELARLLFPEGASAVERQAVDRLARWLHAYFWVAPDDRADRRVRACWRRISP
ncbi:MAG: hypothetical protein H7841_13800 [Magnetospirillum sp. WYHS-4]